MSKIGNFSAFSQMSIFLHFWQIIDNFQTVKKIPKDDFDLLSFFQFHFHIKYNWGKIIRRENGLIFPAFWHSKSGLKCPKMSGAKKIYSLADSMLL